MKAEDIRWWMEVFRHNVFHAMFPLVLSGFSVVGIAIMRNDIPARGFFVLFGCIVAILGIVLCFFSAVGYDRLRFNLRAAEAIERQEKKKEEKNAKRPKANKTDRT